MRMYLCAISNIKSGACKEDCIFCSQSRKYKANIPIYPLKRKEDILIEAKKAKKARAFGFCLVSSGKELEEEQVDIICDIASIIKKEVGLFLISCHGIATLEALKELKRAGIDSYNHNLETSREFYPKICSTHTWEERFLTCENIKRAGLKLCSGGIFGLGETKEDWISLFKSLKELKVDSMPINFYHPNKALPIKEIKLNKSQAIEVIKLAKKIVNPFILMVAGGRERMFPELFELIELGVNSIVIGDYLTTKGNEVSKDLLELEKLGVEIYG